MMQLLGLLRAGRSFLSGELANIRRTDVPWRRRLWTYRHGVFSDKNALWDLSEDTVTDYLSDFQGRASNTTAVDGVYGEGLKNKLFFHLLFSDSHDELLPDVYGLVRDGQFVETSRFDGLSSFDRLVDALEAERIVAKPVVAAQGDGIRVLSVHDGQFRINSRRVTEAELIEELSSGRDLILEAFVSQADYAADIYPGAANTVRVITMVDPVTDSPFIAAAMHRFGTAASGTVDNASTGGISAKIDPESGELSEAVAPPDGKTGTATWMDTHPDTDTRISGTVIPEWERVREQVLRLAAEYGWLWPYVGWDVIVTDDRGSIAVIEGNRDPGTKFIQVHQPLLADERVRRFYDHHGVL